MAVITTTACSTSGGESSGAGSSGTSGGKTIQVVAAENFWGSIASQLGGSHVKVTSIINNPDADPHDYEPSAADARTVAGSQFTIVNGIGYDAWADRLLSANTADGRTYLKVGDLVGLKPGGNPHRWYSPDDVHKVIEKITSDYKSLDPGDSADFDKLKSAYETDGLAEYNRLIFEIKTKYAGTPIGASEWLVSPLADGLGLKMLTPDSFLTAISEGTDPTARDKSAMDQQIAGKQMLRLAYGQPAAQCRPACPTG